MVASATRGDNGALGNLGFSLVASLAAEGGAVTVPAWKHNSERILALVAMGDPENTLPALLREVRPRATLTQWLDLLERIPCTHIDGQTGEPRVPEERKGEGVTLLPARTVEYLIWQGR